MKLKMFSALKLNSLKCQSNGSGEGKVDKCGEEEDDEISDHMYEKLPNFHNKSCKCHLNHPKRSHKLSKSLFSKRNFERRMECPSIPNLRNSQDDLESKNNHGEEIREMHDFEQPVYTQQGMIRTKVTTVNIQREEGTLGITLRGGFHQNAELSRPVVITYIKPDGPAAREGTIKPGDRLLAVDGFSLEGSSLGEAQTLLRQPTTTTLLTIEYDVGVHSVEHIDGPLLVEIERSATQPLGLTLFQNENGIIIERIKPGSLADRSGALRVGDEILAVNANRIDGANIALEDVIRILECECPLVRLEILPSHSLSYYPNCGSLKSRDHILPFGSTFSGGGTLRSKKSKGYAKDKTENGFGRKTNFAMSTGFSGAEIALTHCETLNTVLSKENGSFGLTFADGPDGNVVISTIAPGGPAERSQCLHPGDRLLAINHRSIILDNLTSKDINDLLEYHSEEGSGSKISMLTEFDVLDSVVPASGIYTVKLVKRGSGGLGITMTASKSSGFIVCEMKKGSVAHRSGSLIPGDKLLAINNIPLEQCSVEYAAHVLHQSSNIVTLKVQRESSNFEMRNNRKITYTVDLQRYGGPLGITIAGSEEPFQPITISGLTANGLAEQTGVIRIGDEILAINNHSLHGEPLSKAHSLLQSSSDLITLKLSRNIVPISRAFNNKSPILPSSIDSAVESWDSSHLDLTSSPDHQKTQRDSAKREAPQWSPSSINFLQPLTDTTQSKIITENESTASDLAILDEITSENLKIKKELDLLSIKLDEQRKSAIQETQVLDTNTASDEGTVPSRTTNITESTAKRDEQEQQEVSEADSEQPVKDMENECRTRESFMTNDFENFNMTYMPETRNWCANQYFGSESQGSVRSDFQSSQLYEVTLYKDPVYEDFGFSVSDGLYERGVFINRIRKGGPADLSNILKPYDRILQVNDTFTQDFDCCLTVPLIASAGDNLVLLVARNTESCPTENEEDKFCNKEMTLSTAKLGPTNQGELRRILV